MRAPTERALTCLGRSCIGGADGCNRLAIFIVDEGTYQGTAALEQICLYNYLLIGKRFDVGLERLIPGKSDADLVIPGNYKHPPPHTRELFHVPDVEAIDKNRGARRVN